MSHFTKKDSPTGKYLSILIWPLLTLYYAITDIRKPYGKNLLWLFVIFYGFIHIVFSEQRGYVDGMSYAWKLKEYHQQEISFEQMQSLIFSEGSKEVDLFIPYLCYFISLFTDNYRVLFIALATIYGFFFSRNISMIVNQYKDKIGAFVVILVVIFAFILPPSSINGRIWIAVQIGLYGILRYYLYGKKSGLIWCAISPLIHFSTLLVVGSVFLNIILPKRPIIFVSLVIATLFISSLNLTALNAVLTNVLPVYEQKIDSYASDEYASFRKENGPTSQHILLYASLLSMMFRIVLVIVFFTNRKIINSDKLLRVFFCLTALLYSAASLMALIPSGARFLNIAAMCVITFCILLVEKLKRTIMARSLQFVFGFLMCYMILFQIRILFENVGFSFFYSNPFLASIFEDNEILLYYLR